MPLKDGTGPWWNKKAETNLLAKNIYKNGLLRPFFPSCSAKKN